MSPADHCGMPTKKHPPSRVAIAALSVALIGNKAPSELRLIPAGMFRAVDGRPEGVEGWFLDDAHAAAIVATAAARVSDYVVDYQHQTLHAEKNGKPAPAAAWFKQLEWRPGDGLYVTDMRWTAAAAQFIEKEEYRYLSPVFAFCKKTGAVLGIRHAALINDPGIDGLTDLAALSASFSDPLTDQLSQEIVMDELLEQLRWLLNLPVGATAEETIAQLQKLIDQIKSGQGETAAASFDLAAWMTSKHAEIAALQAKEDNQVDLTKYVPVEAYLEKEAEVVALSAKQSISEVEQLVAAGRADGRIEPALEPWAKTQSVAALSAYLEKKAPVVKIGTTQSGGDDPKGAAGSLSEEQLAVCQQMGVAPDEYIKTLAT